MWVTYYYPESYPINTLTWWIYFLIFDIWLNQMFKDHELKKLKTNDEEESL